MAAFGEDLLFIGSSNSEGQGGIYLSRFANGTLTEPKRVFDLPRKVTIELSPDHRLLYASLSSAARDGEGELIALRILDDGILEEINRGLSGVDHFCSMAGSPNGRHLIGSSFALGVVSSFRCDSKDGIGKQTSRVELPRFAKDKSSQVLARAHDVEFSRDGRFAFVADIANDRIYTFSLDEKTGELKEVGYATSEAFVGPRHLTFNEKGDVVYVLCQRGSCVTAFRHDGKGKLTEFQTISSLPPHYEGPTNHSAEVLLHPNGQFLYASNRGHNSLAVYRVKSDGVLTSQQIIASGGEAPWSFVFDSTGAHLICSNLKTSNLVVFEIDPKTGELSPISKVSVPEPISLAFRIN